MTRPRAGRSCRRPRSRHRTAGRCRRRPRRWLRLRGRSPPQEARRPCSPRSIPRTAPARRGPVYPPPRRRKTSGLLPDDQGSKPAKGPVHLCILPRHGMAGGQRGVGTPRFRWRPHRSPPAGAVRVDREQEQPCIQGQFAASQPPRTAGRELETRLAHPRPRAATESWIRVSMRYGA